MRNFFTLFAFAFALLAMQSFAQQEEGTFTRQTGYLLHLPDTGKGPFPMIVFLHGSGERGTDLALVKKNGPPAFLDDTTGFPFIVLSPQCPLGRRWDTKMLIALIDYVISTAPVDQQRIYLTGLSMGGEGTWNLAMDYPDRFAAIAPVCGRNNLHKVCALKELPVWVFHGAKDDVVPPYYSERIVDTLRAMGADVKYTLDPEADHNSWDLAYSNTGLYAWFLMHSRDTTLENTKLDIAAFTGIYKSEDGIQLEVYQRENRLRIITSEGWDFFYDRIGEKSFRLPGPWFDGRDLTFHFSSSGDVISFITGPCEGKVYKMESRNGSVEKE